MEASTFSVNCACSFHPSVPSIHFLFPVCELDADVVFQSSDSVKFRIHSNNLSTFAGAFPPAELGKDEVVLLSESSHTLELLFKFVYPKRYPSLAAFSFEVIAPLAEAAEKYEVYAAIHITRAQMP